MKRITFILSILLCSQLLVAQQEITPEVLNTLKADVDKQAIQFKANLVTADEFTAEQIEFSVDTFKVERIAARCMEIDYSTMGMVESVNRLAASYDIILNKYYKKLLNSLKGDDKKVLIEAQRAWISYRDAEAKLIGTLTKEVYSGGGTIQVNIAAGAYSAIISKRANEIFNYYNEILK